MKAALVEGNPYLLAAGLQNMVNSGRTWAAEGNWSFFRPLADTVDDLLAARAQDMADDTALSTLITLARQVCAVLALLGDAGGIRDTGYFRASLAHARRLDAMTDNRLHLVDLVELVRE
jgi:hypothetical protein